MIPTIFSVIGTLITHPRLAFKMALVERRGLGQAFLVLLLSYLGLSGSMAIALGGIVSIFFHFMPQLSWLAHLILSGIVVALVPILLVLWVINMLLTYALAKALGGEGDIESTAVVMAFSEVVTFVPVLLALPAFFNPITGILTFMLGVIIWLIWSLVLKIIGISEAHALSIGRSIVAVLLGHLLLVILLMVVGLLFAVVGIPGTTPSWSVGW